MAIYSGPWPQIEEEIKRLHCEERLPEIEKIRDAAPEHHKPDIDRLWELIRDAATS